MKLSYYYYILCTVRIIFTLFPQTGYIHPDEHFQGPEIVYGDIFNFRVHQAWEFTDEKPIRNIVFPYFITGFPSLLTDFLGIKNLHGTFLFPYFMLVLPRIIMCSLSFLNDLLIYRTCIFVKKDYKIPLLCKFKNPNENDYATAIKLSFILGLTFALGIFNRPTFVCFAAFPILVFLFFLLRMQGGVYSSLSYIHSSLQSRTNSAVVFYKTYMPPRYVLGLTESQKDISVYDFAGIDENGFEDLLNNLILQSEPQYVYVIIPHEISIYIRNLSIFQSNYKFVARKSLFPHLSTESLPKLSDLINVILSKSSFWQKMSQIKKFLSIHILIFKTNI
ncbi:mannosyltransferase [Nephila pilipes]|uniref:Mannosyltransferase n=1 Tax=Nephila pilipes TaxID=299642 RepID=A0A8X6PY41_NEPPI|nr:mannosyltransferase [Nephila pilipes]